MGFNLDDYEPVAARLSRWLNDCGAREVRGRVITDLVHHADGWCVFRAELYEDTVLIATGWAEEHATQRGVNATSHVENCETSAVGRALANAGHAGNDPTRRPSREEMKKAQTGERAQVGERARSGQQRTQAQRPPGTPTAKMLNYYRKLVHDKGVDVLPEAETDFDTCRAEIDRLLELP